MDGKEKEKHAMELKRKKKARSRRGVGNAATPRSAYSANRFLYMSSVSLKIDQNAAGSRP